MSEQITEIILLIAPSIITILSMLGIVAKVILNFKALKKEVLDLKGVENLKIQLGQVIQENHELKCAMNELLTKIDHVKRD